MAIKVLARKLVLATMAFGMFGSIAIAAAVPAWCATCQTSCYRDAVGSTYCTTNCF